MRKKLSKKQIGAMGLAAMMAVQTPAMAAETSQEAATQETTTQELQATEAQTPETQPEESLAEEVESPEAQPTEKQPEEITDSVEISESETEGLMDQYSLTENQGVLEDGWHQDSDGNHTYVKNGELVRNEVLQIDGKYYGFDNDGKMRVKNRFYKDGFYYYSTEDGSLLLLLH